MIIKGKIKKGEYFDSITLMRVGKEISALPGVIDAAVVMGTKENKSILKTSNLLVTEFDNSSDTDLLVAVSADSAESLENVFKKVDECLLTTRKKVEGTDEFNPRSLESALKVLPEANLVIISIAGKYAGLLAEQALERDLNVMLFSDNVSLETEISLKKHAEKKGLLVMGPDCGTAIINGVPIAFANAVNRGNIGIIAAAGTGLQELTSIISNEGAGISQAIGTGGRDVKKEVGGIMFIAGLRALADDPSTKVIVLVSKPPHISVIKKIAAELKKVKKEVIAVFLGADESELRNYGISFAVTLEEAALKAVALSKNLELSTVDARIHEEELSIQQLANEITKKLKPNQKYLRGLFSGGTFCAEAQIILQDSVRDIYSNAPTAKSKKLENSLVSINNTMIDLGEDEFTVGRPHPMIDFSLRNKKIIEEANNPEVAVILLDVVLGYGANQNPINELAPVLKDAASKVIVVCSVTGTDLDPQNRAVVVNALKDAGAIVMQSNAAACKLVGQIIKCN